MSPDQATADAWVVRVVEPSSRRAWYGLRRGEATLASPAADVHLYIRSRQPDGSEEIQRVINENGGPVFVAEGAQGLYVSLSRQPLSLAFSSVLRDQQGNMWDLHVRGSWSIADSRRFVCSSVVDAVIPGTTFSGDLAQSWMMRAVRPMVRDAIEGRAIEDLRDRDALPAKWWEKRLLDWLAEFGVAVHVDEVSWVSAQAESAEAEAARQRYLERIARAREQERQAELAEAAAKAEYEKRKEQIEADRRLSQQEREHQLQLLEMCHRKELIEAETEIENARRAAEIASLEHDRTVARLRQDTEAVNRTEGKWQQAQDHHETVLKVLGELKAELAKLANLPDNLLAQLASRDAKKANAAAERVVSLEFGLSAYALARLGFRVERQNLVQCLREKAAADGQPVVVRKTELVTRDLGTAKVKALPVNTSLQFEFSTTRAGDVTLLNIGTSGAVYVHVPNAYVSPDQAKVDAGRTYAVPGPELLPWDRLRQLGLDYVEIGPPGWEHIAVLISERPLISARALARVSSDCPFLKLAGDDIAELCNTLSEDLSGWWSAGVLSFLVD